MTLIPRTSRLARLASAILFAILLASGGPSDAAGSIVIGRSIALSGPLRSSGEAKRDGADAYIRRINARGGIYGRAIEVVTLDDAYDPATTVSNLRKIAAENKPVAFLGLFGLPTAAAALPVLEDLRVPAVGLTSGSDELRAPFKQFVFPVRGSFADEARKVVSHVKTVGTSRVVVAYTDNPFGEGVKTTILGAISDAGLRATVVKIDPAGISAAGAARQVISDNPQAVLFAMATPAAVPVLAELKKASFRGPTYSFSAVDASIVAKQLGQAARGLAITRVVPPPNAVQVPVVAEYLSALKDMNRGVPSFFGLEGYLEAKVLVEGLKRAGANPSATSLVAGLETMRDLNLGGFFVNYQPRMHTGSTFVEIDIISASGTLAR